MVQVVRGGRWSSSRRSSSAMPVAMHDPTRLCVPQPSSRLDTAVQGLRQTRRATRGKRLRWLLVRQYRAAIRSLKGSARKMLLWPGNAGQEKSGLSDAATSSASDPFLTSESQEIRESKEWSESMAKSARVVVTMPAYYAEQTLEKTYREIPVGLADEVIVVDDASTDRTAHVARELGLTVFVHPANRGYGGNQKTCYDQALATGADIVVLLHPDYQYDPKTLTALVAPLIKGRADFTFGSRFANGANPRAGGMPLYRYVGNKLTTAIENLALGTSFAELHSGLKAYSRAFLQSHNYH